MATSDVEILIKATDKASKQIDRVNKGVKKLGDESDKTAGKVKKSSSVWKGLQNNWQAIAMGGAAVAGALYAVKKAYDFGKEGAVIKQTAASFDMLLEKVGAAPNLLNQLRDASRGTVDDMTIMSGTALVLAGVSGELAENIAAATPELMAIAKAANKLNPSLGDTAFMYQSIATGVKRAQPLILDNLGLTIKVGSANEAMAEQLGKSVEQLTAEEKSMAILNDTLRAGKVLIDQVGGSTESLTDAYEKMGAGATNYFNEMKKMASGIGGAGGPLGDYLNLMVALRQEIEKGNVGRLEGTQILVEVITTYKTAEDAIDDLTDSVVDTTVTNENWLLRQEELVRVGAILRDNTRDVDWEVRNVERTMGKAAKTAKIFAPTIKDVLDEMDRDVRSPIANFRKDLEWWAAGGGAISEAFTALQSLELGVDVSAEDADEFARKLELAAADLEVELDPGSIDKVSEEVATSLNMSMAEVKAYILSTEGPAGALEAIEGRDWKTFIDVYFQYHNAPPGFTSGGYVPEDVVVGVKKKPGGGYSKLAAGGPALAGVPYIVGERGAELFMPKTSGTVVPNDKMGSMGVTNIFYKIVQLPGEDGMALAQRIERNKMMSMRSGALYSGAH